MRGLAEFTKTSLIGGVLIILPLYLSILLLLKTLAGVGALIAPVTAQLPAAIQFRQVIAMLIVIFYTVFVPSVPTPAAGAIYILPRERVHQVDISFARAAAVITKWGAGARDLRAAMRMAGGADSASRPSLS
jgi:uncharacterized membrane protein